MRIAVTANLKKDITASVTPAEEFSRGLFEGEADEEFDRPETVAAIREVLEKAGHETFFLPADPEVLTKLKRSEIDFVFNIAEGTHGRNREAYLPALLEAQEIPYSGSDPLTLSLTLDKSVAKFASLGAGVATPDFVILRDGDIQRTQKLPFPLFVKPAWEGSSKGIRSSSRVYDEQELVLEVSRVRAGFPDQPILVERFLAGREFTVGVLGNDPPRILGVMEVKSQAGEKDFIYSLETKRDWEKHVLYECPVKNLSLMNRKSMEAMALRLYEVFGCRDFTRFDFRMNEHGKAYFLEANPLPGLNPESGDFVIMARLQGWTYNQLILAILDAAMKRLGLR